MARPIEWTIEIMQEATDIICSRIALGESVRKILSEERDRDVLPSRKTFYEWLAQNKSLCDQYATFLEIRSDDMADEMLNIADSVEDDVITTEDGREVVNHNVINRDRLRVDTRKWLLAKLHPKKYGEKISQELTGAGGAPLIPKQEIDLSKLSNDDLRKLIELQAKAGVGTP